MTSIQQKQKSKKNLSITKSSLTHLYLNGKELQKLEDNFQVYKKLKVLYLHQNQLTLIENLNGLTNLTHLYLQRNNIQNMNNLNKLENLEKLYLGYNEIKRLENIEKLKKLKELHLEGQRIDENVEFSFDVLSLSGLSKSLDVLNVSKLNLKSIKLLDLLHNMTTLIATGNSFKSPEDIADDLGRFISLKHLNLVGCPAQRDLHYRIKITAGANKLEYLDEKFIPKTCRTFIKSFAQKKTENLMPKNKEPIQIQRNELGTKIFKKNIKKSISFDMLNMNQTDDLGFRAWNSLNFVQKPMRTVSKKSIGNVTKPNMEYHLQGKNIM